MSTHDYHFVTHWIVKGKIDDVYHILKDATGYPRWWGDCYVSVTEEIPVDEKGLNGSYKIVNRGKLPYTLTWYSSVHSFSEPTGFTIHATGELAGTGKWEFIQKGEMVDILFYWDVSLGKSWLKSLSFFLKPILISNHNWVMSRGEKHLQRELEKRKS